MHKIWTAVVTAAQITAVVFAIPAHAANPSGCRRHDNRATARPLWSSPARGIRSSGAASPDVRRHGSSRGAIQHIKAPEKIDPLPL